MFMRCCVVCLIYVCVYTCIYVYMHMHACICVHMYVICVYTVSTLPTKTAICAYIIYIGFTHNTRARDIRIDTDMHSHISSVRLCLLSKENSWARLDISSLGIKPSGGVLRMFLIARSGFGFVGNTLL